MNTSDIKPGRAYRGTFGEVYRVLDVFGRGRSRQVRYETMFPGREPQLRKVRDFALAVVEDVTEQTGKGQP